MVTLRIDLFVYYIHVRQVSRSPILQITVCIFFDEDVLSSKLLYTSLMLDVACTGFCTPARFIAPLYTSICSESDRHEDAMST